MTSTYYHLSFIQSCCVPAEWRAKSPAGRNLKSSRCFIAAVPLVGSFQRLYNRPYLLPRDGKKHWVACFCKGAPPLQGCLGPRGLAMGEPESDNGSKTLSSIGPGLAPESAFLRESLELSVDIFRVPIRRSRNNPLSEREGRRESFVDPLSPPTRHQPCFASIGTSAKDCVLRLLVSLRCLYESKTEIAFDNRLLTVCSVDSYFASAMAVWSVAHCRLISTSSAFGSCFKNASISHVVRCTPWLARLSLVN